ncbi:MAG: TonB-dependent receptor domain-containing protein [Bacteroidota bacterium]
MNLKKSFLALMLSMAFSAVFGQNGHLRGKIIDDEFGDALIGATIVLENDQLKGTTADFNGDYSISLAPGTYSVLVSYVSFATMTIKDIEIKADEVTSLDIRMKSDLTELEAVVVSAEVVRDSETALLTVQKKSANVLDGISSQTFSKNGDNNLSAAIGRVTGVSVQDGKYVYVRGLGDRYTKTTLNGMNLPGLDPDNNSVQIDLFPTSVLENVIVYKTFSPDLYGDFSGGLVNVETKSFPEEKVTSLTLGFSYNPAMHFNDNYLTYQGGNLDFLGFDDGTRKLPFNSDTRIPNEVLNDPQLETLTRSFNKQLGAERKMNFMNTSLSFNHGNQKDFEGFTLGYNAVLNYQNRFNYFDNTTFSSIYLKNQNTASNNLVAEELRTGELGEHNVLWSALLTGAIKFRNSEISANLMRIQNGISRTAVRTNQNFEQTGATLAENILTYTQRSLTNFMLSGKHNFDGKMLNWTSSTSLSRIYDPDFRITSISVTGGDTTLLVGDGAGINRFYRDLHEFNESVRVDYTIPYMDKSKLQFGLTGSYRARDFKIDNYNFRYTNALDISYDPNWFLQDQNIWTPQTTQGSYVVGNFEPANTYEASQVISGAFAMTEMNFADRWRAIYGLRAEHVTMFYTGQNNLGSVVYNNENTLQKLDLLPSANLVYSLAEGMNLRGSYNRTLARPSFKEKSVAQIFDPISRITFLGNIDLQETHIDNFDLRWEYFFRGDEMLSISGFYKHFDGHIEFVALDTDRNSLKPRNSGISRVFGTEIEFRKKLGFITPTLENLSIGTNISIVRSYVDLNSVIVDNNGGTEYDLRANYLREGEVLSNTRDMAGQAPYLINAYLNFVDPKSDFNVNVSYNVQGESLAIIGSGRFPDVYTQPFHSLNMNVFKSFGPNRNSKITLAVKNILDAKQYQLFRSYQADDVTYSSFTPGRLFSVKYGYTF